jgi:hypothetical protein
MYRALSHRRVVNIRMRKIWGQSCQWSWKYSCGKPVRTGCKLG